MNRQLRTILIAAAAGALAYWAIASFVLDSPTSEDRQRETPDTTTTPAVSNTPAEPESTSTAEEALRDEARTEQNDAPAERRYPISGTPEHPASGEVRVVLMPDERIIRYENYNGTAGPELHVYLATDREATEYVDLGPARSTSGNINYSVPFDVDISAYAYVLTWSEESDELYDYAAISD